MEQGQQWDKAEAHFRRALGLRPNHAPTYVSLGNLLKLQGRLVEAEECYRQALHLQPGSGMLYNDLGGVLKDQGQLAQAEACFRQVVHDSPDLAAAHVNLGVTLMEQSRHEEAQACFRQALRLQPDFGLAQENLLMALTYDPQADAEEVFAEHRRWGSVQPRPTFSHANDPDPDRPLRIGYVSCNFRKHAETRFFEPILAHHDPTRCAAYCYSDVRRLDAVTARLQALASGWRSIVELPDDQVAELIRADRIDILVDLAGHTANNRLRLFALKPVPVQVSYLGYPNTTGLEAIDYKLTDAVLDPPDDPRTDARYTEELVRLSVGVVCFAPPEDAPGVAPAPAMRSGRITFGSLHNLAKLNAGVFDLWSSVLRAVPSSRLLLYRHTLLGATRDRIEGEFVSRGIDAGRLDLRHGGVQDYLAVYGDIDIGLDVFPWSGGTTSCEALWMGVPVLALAGDRHSARGTASALSCIGATDLTARTAQDYVALAVRLAGDGERRAWLRANLRHMMTTTLCDGQRFTLVLQEAYRAMWRHWCQRHR